MTTPINCAISGVPTGANSPVSPFVPCPYENFGLDNYDRDAPISYLRFFNQPIEQIPGYEEGKFQILTHGCHVGLHWHTPICVEVIVHACTGVNPDPNPNASNVRVYYQNMYVIAEYSGGFVGDNFLGSCPT